MIRIKFHGTGDAVFAFSEFAFDTAEKVRDTILETAQEVSAMAKSLAPVDTGKLRRDIRILKGKLKDFKVTVTYMGKGKAYWGKFVEFGTFEQASKPFMGPAIDAAIPKFEQNMDALTKRVPK